MLQAKAYGPDGALSSVEVARLHQLERPRRPEGVQPGETPRTDDTDRPAGSVHRPGESAVQSQPGVESEPGSEHEPGAESVDAPGDTSQQARRRHPLLVAAAAIAVLAVGVGIGWLAFGRDTGPAIPVTAEQQARGETLAEEADLDPGTIIAMAQEQDVLVWMGTRDEGEITCMIIDDGEYDTPSCGQTESVMDTGLYGTLTRDAPPDSSGNDIEMISASLGFHGQDEPVAMIQREWAMSSQDSFLDQFTDPQQRATAARLLDEGFDNWSPTLAAFDEQTPIWIAARDNGQQVCLFYGDDPEAPSACASMDAAKSEGVNLTVLSWADGAPSGVSVTLRYTEQMMASIVITPVPASDLIVDRGSGDPIEFSFEDPSPNGVVSDGETVETSG